jgi:hypothetical protein
MARLKIKQLLSNLQYDATENKLMLSGSNTSSEPDFVITGSVYVKVDNVTSGSLTIDGVNTFGDSGSFYTVDLGEY